MNLNQLSLVNLTAKKMEFLANRQKVITENVANADTPRFKAKETSSFGEFLSTKTKRVGTYITDDNHISRSSTNKLDVKTDKDAWGANPNGNTVSLEQQSIKSSEIEGNYKMAINLYKKSFNLYYTALGKTN